MCLFIDVNNQQDATTFSFMNLFNSALHVSGDKFAHPQEHFLTIYSFWYNAPTLLPSGAPVMMHGHTNIKFKNVFIPCMHAVTTLWPVSVG
jgi:hypothetical protein